MSSDLRRDAELRAKALQQAKQRQIEYSKKIQIIHQGPSAAAATPQTNADEVVDRRSSIYLLDASDPARNNTPSDARLFEMDYQLNGSRARCDSGDFVPPRWILDQEVCACTHCGSLFDILNRRHHCRFVVFFCFY